jgi:drug/metabolite transporter (DMT)-like permease
LSDIATLKRANLRRGVILIAAGIFCFTAMDALAKALLETYSTATVVWARFAGHLLFVVLYLGRRVAPSLVTTLPWWHVLRSLTQLGATVFFFLSLNYIGLAEATALASINPLLITLGAGLFLGEGLGRARIIGVCVALVGAMIVIRPGLAVFSPAALLPLICAGCFAANMLLTRHVGTRESPWAAMIYAALLGTLATSALLPIYGQPILLPDVPWFLLLGLLGAVAQLFIIRAYSTAEAGAMAPFGYLDIVFATGWGIAAFGEFPDSFTIVGALVIVAAGLYVWRQETVGAAPKPMV